MTVETYLADLATYLQTQGYGTTGKTTSGTSIQIAGYYENTDNAIYITPYGGSDKQMLVTSEEDASHPDFQILVRNTNQQTAISTSTRIYRLLRKKADFDIGTSHFIFIKGKAPPIFVRKTNSGYYEYSINFTSMIA